MARCRHGHGRAVRVVHAAAGSCPQRPLRRAAGTGTGSRRGGPRGMPRAAAKAEARCSLALRAGIASGGLNVQLQQSARRNALT